MPGSGSLFHGVTDALGPANNPRVSWRQGSGLFDQVLGGFYDAGDYVKFVWPQARPCARPWTAAAALLGGGCLQLSTLSCLQAFSITMLAWIGLQYPGSFQATNSYSALLSNVRCAACL